MFGKKIEIIKLFNGKATEKRGENNIEKNNDKISKAFLAIFGVSAVLFAILFLTDRLIQITHRN